MSATFSLRSTSSLLTLNVYPPLKLESDYCIGLVGLYTYNSVPNIDVNENNFFYRLTSAPDRVKTITIPVGSYEIDAIEKYLQEQIIRQNDEFLHVKKLSGGFRKQEELDKIFSLKANNNTLRCEIKSSKLDVDFTRDNSINRILGFSKRLLASGVKHESDCPVDIVKVQIVRVRCNIVHGSFCEEGTESHILFEFPISVDPGFALNIEPRNIIYLPVNTDLIQNITVQLIDQDGDLVNFAGERIIVRLELKRCP